jgi:hypothetical protein
MDEEGEDLFTKLEGYREQLQQVEALLLDAPDEPSLLKLKQDLTEVITLTEDLVRYQDEEKKEEEQAPAPVAQAKGPTGGIVGRTCEIVYDSSWFNAEIMSHRRDERGVERLQVKILGLGTVKECKLQEVKLLKPPHAAQLTAGTACQAINLKDGLWYDGVIAEQTAKGYLVHMQELNMKQEVFFDRVRLGQSAKKRTVKEIITPGGYKIPESLQLVTGDTEEVIAAKRRKIHALKNQQKDGLKAQKDVSKANSWQKFNKKSSARSKTGFLTGKSKDSIFKVPEHLDGRVGVVGSGKGMTDFGDRVKFTYNNLG